MKIEKNKVAALSYELEVEGKIADKADAGKPLEYIHGTGMLIPRFEQEVEGKEPGESFEFTLSATEGYGEYNPEYKFDIPKSSFAGEDGRIREDLLKPGLIIPMLNSAGQVVQGRIDAVGEETVTMDFNHPMAGKTLHFTGKVESVRDASEEELTNGLHGEYLPREECDGHCGGGCSGNHEGGCCHEEGGHHEGGCCHDGGDKKGCCHKKD